MTFIVRHFEGGKSEFSRWALFANVDTVESVVAVVVVVVVVVDTVIVYLPRKINDPQTIETVFIPTPLLLL